ncbi:sequestosome-1-like [Dermacentor albipictus]|uniref:sequestosome-1-like n=1 Tax=Dermacentor albipictus TaxID=60249 RepID=UPI0031FBC30F
MDNHQPQYWNMSSTSSQPQMDPVKVTVKAYLGDEEIRRFVIEDLRNFKTLHDRIWATFPALATMDFILRWKDPEGDYIVMSSDAELAEALQNMTDGLLRIYVDILALRWPAVAGPSTANPAAAGLGTLHGAPAQRVHAGVLCDACDREICGVRYKCLQCEDYDLCGSCHGRKMHEEHDMLKLVNPGIRPLWAFPGWKRLWRHCGYPRRGGGGARGGPAQSARRSPPHHGPDQKQQYQEILRGVGYTVANFLEPFGITVDVLNDMASNTSPQEQPKRDSATEPMDSSAGPSAGMSSVAEPPKPVQVEAAAAGNSSATSAVLGGPIKASETNSEGAVTQETPRASEPAVEVEVPPGWTLLNALRDPLVGDDNGLPRPMSPEVVPAAPILPAAQAGDNPVDIALGQMLAMGFNNEGGWLRQLLEVKQGDVGAVLEWLNPRPK